jgi:hypothetical protein
MFGTVDAMFGENMAAFHISNTVTMGHQVQEDR